MNESITFQKLIKLWLKDHKLLNKHFAYSPNYLSHISICGKWCISIFPNSVAVWAGDESWGVREFIESYDQELFNKLEQVMLKDVNNECEGCNELSL